MKNPTIPNLNLPIHSIFCIGRNYVDHIHELQNAIPEEPVVFTKPLSSVCYSGQSIVIPPQSTDVHHEIEIVVALGKDIPMGTFDGNSKVIAGIGLGIDVTARDIQAKLKSKGLPWDKAKGLDTFTVLGGFESYRNQNLQDLSFELAVNDTIRQSGNTSLMMFPIISLIQHLNTYYSLYAGDLIFTGTPAGVAKLESGDHLHGEIHGTDVNLFVTVV